MKVECYSEDFICSVGNIDNRKHIVKPHYGNFKNTICIIDNDKNLLRSGFRSVDAAIAYIFQGGLTMNYTKGPWTLKDNRGEFEIPEINVLWTRSHSSDKARDEEIKNSERGQMELGNARLMTASPLMYEALKAIDDTYTRCPCCHNLRRNGHDYTCKLEQALAKAEGKEE